MTDQGTILILEDDRASLGTLSEYLESQGYKVESTFEPGTLADRVRERRYDALVLDFRADGDASVALIPSLKETDPTLEIIVITEPSAGDEAMTAISRGAYSYLQRPVRLAALSNRIRAAITTRRFHDHTRLLLDSAAQEETPLSRHVGSLQRLLRFDRELMSVMDYRRVIDAILAGVLDLAGSDVAALLLVRDTDSQVMSRAKTGATTPGAEPLIDALLAGWSDWGGSALDRERLTVSASSGAGNAIVTDSVVAPLVVHDSLIGAVAAFATGPDILRAEAAAVVPIVASRAEIVVENVFLHEHTKLLATTDALTGLLNRRVFRETLIREFERSHRDTLNQRPGGELSVIMSDVDHFKSFNDTYGHQLGDEVLKMVGEVMIDEAKRATDVAARYGGEEFIIIAPHTNLENAAKLADRIRERLATTSVQSEAGPLHVTASFGVASYPVCAAHDPDELVQLADEALYVAKDAGRNRVATAPLAAVAEDAEIVEPTAT